jgi:2-desacetyl-2-hydroxyethyl bacteriochlorophyllide A dehydrogenase
MAEYLMVPSKSLLHGDGLTLDELALVEPLAIGAHGVRRAEIVNGENVLIIGAGPIGMGTMEMAKIAGANVIAMDINGQRLQFCKEKLNVSFTLNAMSKDIVQQLAEITNGDMPTVVIDATGNLKAINTGFQYLSHGGKYILIGLQKGEIFFSHPEFHKREATLMSSRNATKEDFQKVMSAMKNKIVNPANYITHRANFSEIKKEFPGWLQPANGVIKAMATMD